MLTDRQAMVLSDKVANELKDEPDRGLHNNPQSYDGRSSVSSGNARNTLIETLGYGKDLRRNKKRERVNLKERRSSSISADNVNNTPETVLSKTPLIQEAWNESESSGEDKRKNQHGTISSEILNSESVGGRGAKIGRLSQEVNENKLAMLKLT